ncbi:MAG: ribose-5-phosphate isomerase RpiA [Ardenticatenia bacterium]|nr:ribose-5-phosphate isomerase RpiA [Ardenticatenia bacterium]
MNPETLKQRAAYYAVDTFVRDGMALGLGTGSTVKYALERLSAHLRSGRLRHIVGVPTSEQTADLSRHLGIPLVSLEETPLLDLYIDGADEIDPELNLIKGLGGALLREKIVACAARHMVVIADERKRVARLGQRAPLPVEVLPFGWNLHADWLAALGCTPLLRRRADGTPFVTDNGNYIYDCTFPGGISAPHELQAQLNTRPGVVEHGLFLGYAHVAVVAGGTGNVSLHRRETAPSSLP